MLVKKPDDIQDIAVPQAATVQPSKPEVYFIKYKTHREEGSNIGAGGGSSTIIGGNNGGISSVSSLSSSSVNFGSSSNNNGLGSGTSVNIGGK